MAFIPVYIFILFFTILIDYYAGLLIEKTQRHKKFFLITSIIANVGVLAFFKYYNFLNGNLKELSDLLGWNYGLSTLKIILPIGLSFHTFQAMSYTIEVYRGKQVAEKHLGIYALYVMYYPQLVAGPIERPQNILPQLHVKHNFDFNKASSGFRLMLWGFFKKIVIADNIAAYVNPIYGFPHSYEALTLTIATFFFAFQIYCDFSGYSDIAIGVSRVMGIDLMKNFNTPYSSKSINEFWNRWHISLSTWFRDYLYIPIGGNRVSTQRRYFNLFFVFMVSGLWHGANWTFVIWGGLHGLYLIFGLITRRMQEKIFNQKVIGNLMQIIITFILVDFAWIFFRANNVADAFFISKKIFLNSFFELAQVCMGSVNRASFLYLNGDRWMFWQIVLLLIFLILLQHKVISNKQMRTYILERPVLRWGGYLFLFAVILFFGKFGSENFIYFQF